MGGTGGAGSGAGAGGTTAGVTPAPVSAGETGASLAPGEDNPSVAALASPPASALVFTIVPAQSTAVFRVREQLAGMDLPTDATGTTNAVSGQIVLLPNSTIVPESSRIWVDLRELRTDDPRRDSFIRQNTLQTAQYPLAEFQPLRAEGLPNPLPASGEHAFRLVGRLTIHGVQRDVTWEVRARRNGAQLTGRASTTVRFGDFNMAPPRVPIVISVVDDIRLELDLSATQATQTP